MKITLILSLFLAVIMSQELSANVSVADIEAQVRKLAQERVDGKEVIVRVYNDWESDPPGYVPVKVRLKGLSFSFQDIKKTLPEIDKTATIVLLGSDQTDRTVASVIGRYVSSYYFNEEWTQSIWPEWQNGSSDDVFFCDALGNPIPNAKVKVELYFGALNSKRLVSPANAALLTTVVLDRDGRYKSPLWGTVASSLTYVISHPNYGTTSEHAFVRADQSRVFILPLVPLDSEAASHTFRGRVLDDSGEPVSSLPVSFRIRTDDTGLKRFTQSSDFVITGENGQFSVYAPLERNGELIREVVPDTLRYHVTIHPPNSFNLHSYSSSLGAPEGFPTGVEPRKFVLQRMNPDQYYHTLTFRDERGVIEDSAELENITATVQMGSRMRQTLTYDQLKDGCYLHLGTIRVMTRRWDKTLQFEQIELTEESPEELVFTAGRERLYQGYVFDAATGKPAPNVLVIALPFSADAGENELAQLTQQIDELKVRAKEEVSQGLLVERLYDFENRIALTDKNGYYKFEFRQGLRDSLEGFTALEKDHYARPVHAFESLKNAARDIIDVPAIELLPPQAQYPPVFIFEDLSGKAITDPNILENIQLEIAHKSGTGRTGRKYRSGFQRQDSWIYGTYNATLNYGAFNYIYEPVTIDWDSSPVIYFRLKQVNDRDVILRGKVVNGITDEPMSGVIVFANGSSFRQAPPSYDLGDYSDILSFIGDDFSPENPAVQMLREALKCESLTCTDSEGHYELRAQRGSVLNNRMSHITAIGENFMGARQRFDYMLPIEEDNPEPIRMVNYEPDEKGIIHFPDMRMFPSAKIKVKLNLPDASSNGRHRIPVLSNYGTDPGDTTPWLQRLWATPRERKGSRIIGDIEVQPNGEQVITVPAGVKLSLTLHTIEIQWTHVTFQNIRLEQGQIYDLGSIELPETFKVNVKVVDSHERPVQGVRVRQVENNGNYYGQQLVTDENGYVSLQVVPYSSGKFAVVYPNRETRENLQEGVNYQVGGPEDEGKEFVLQISDEMLYRILNQGE